MIDPAPSSILRAGLIGKNIGRSRLQAALEILSERQGRSLEFQPFDTVNEPGFHFATQIAELWAHGFSAITVTHPYKTDADALSDRRDGYPENLGAANLLRFETGGLRSFNTDFTGMLAAWRARFGGIEPGRVAVAGAGGVARAIVAALIRLGAGRIDIWDKQADRATALVAQIDPDEKIARAIPVSGNSGAIAQADGLINATPLGMAEYPGMAFQPDDFARAKWAFDAVYTPIDTAFMNTANAAGLDTLSGFELFKHMAIRTFAAYTDTVANPQDVALLDRLAKGL